MAVEHEIVTCPDCQSRGMVDGARCASCNGQGFTRVRAVPAIEPEDDAVPPLESLRKADLVAIAESRGLDTGGTKADLIGRILETEAATEAAAEIPAIEPGDDKGA